MTSRTRSGIKTIREGRRRTNTSQNTKSLFRVLHFKLRRGKKSLKREGEGGSQSKLFCRSFEEKVVETQPMGKKRLSLFCISFWTEHHIYHICRSRFGTNKLQRDLPGSILPTFYVQHLHEQIPKVQKRQSTQAAFYAFGIFAHKRST